MVVPHPLAKQVYATFGSVAAAASARGCHDRRQVSVTSLMTSRMTVPRPPPGECDEKRQDVTRMFKHQLPLTHPGPLHDCRQPGAAPLRGRRVAVDFAELELPLMSARQLTNWRTLEPAPIKSYEDVLMFSMENDARKS